MNQRRHETAAPARRVPHVRLSVRAFLLVVLLVGGGSGWTVRSVVLHADAIRAIEKAGGRAEYQWRWSGGEYLPAGRPPGPPWLHAYVVPDLVGHVTAVWLYHCEAGDSLMPHLGRLRRIEHLLICWSHISDPSLDHLAGLKQLEWLDLADSTVGDAGMAHLAGLSQLKSLDLAFTQVGDSGLARLASLKQLEELNLAGTRISDAGLVYLTGMRRLKKLDLSVTSVSPNGLESLRAALPSIEIRH